jgi:hypothetical protein
LRYAHARIQAASRRALSFLCSSIVTTEAECKRECESESESERERERERVRERGNDYEDEQEGELMNETDVVSRHCVDVKQRKRAGGVLGVTPREPDMAKDKRGEEEEEEE